ncbi:MAG: AAA family ATPase [Rhodospirillales bacterium RIFCSPLOWO2_12_FULL_67_15]|nr:MAG: AAA family ATPase [Rhodospirillales bacterium RIFCSPLOWO2_12_FULL_67_15]
MDRVRNPFAPGAGTPPPALVGREEILNDAQVTIARVKAGRPEKSFLLIGLRGVGKTVLLNRIQEMAESAGYRAIFVEAPENKRLPALLIPPLRQILLALDRLERVNEYVKRGLRVLKSFTIKFKPDMGDFDLGLDIDPELGAADSGDLEIDLSELLFAVAQAAAARSVHIAIFIDEMQYLNEDELSALIMAIHKVAQKKMPLLLVGAGLPQLVGLTGKSNSYAERLFNFPTVGPLKPPDAKNALRKPVENEGVKFREPALDEIARVTQGYPYFLQEWGYHTWNIANASPISLEDVRAAHTAVIQRLDESFFRVRFDRLTPREKDYLRAMAELGPEPHRSGDIADVLGVGVQSVAPLRSGLIKKGMIFSPAHGDTAFTVPLFDEFMKRIMPEMKRRKSLSRR